MIAALLLLLLFTSQFYYFVQFEDGASPFNVYLIKLIKQQFNRYVLTAILWFTNCKFRVRRTKTMEALCCAGGVRHECRKLEINFCVITKMA